MKYKLIFVLLFCAFMVGCDVSTDAPTKNSEFAPTVSSPTDTAIVMPPESTENIPATGNPTDATHESGVTEPVLWYQQIVRNQFVSTGWANPVIEEDGVFYFTTEDSLVCCDPLADETKILTHAVISGLFPYDGKIYYSTEREIFCFDPVSGSIDSVWDYSLRPEGSYVKYDYIQDFRIYEGCLYVRLDGLKIVRYNLATNVSEFFLEDFSGVAFCGNYCYFGNHSQRTFSIYRMHLDTNEISLVRSDGKSWDSYNKVRYDCISSAHGNLYYFIRGTGDIYRYSENADDVLILDESALDSYVGILDHPSYDNLLYWVETKDKWELYELDAEGTSECVLTILGNNAPRQIYVTESAVFWQIDSESAMDYAVK